MSAPDSEPDDSMNSRVSWSDEGIDPSVRERAEAAARRAGMSLSDWLNSTLGDPAAASFRSPYDQRPAMPGQESREVADIHRRLDSIAWQIEQISQPKERNEPRNDGPRSESLRSEPAVARQLNEAISRLDARLSQISSPTPARPAQMPDKPRQADLVERPAAPAYRPSPPLSPVSLEAAIAEVAARQNELDSVQPRQMPPRSAPPIAPAAPGPDFSSLERHLLKITSQIEALQRPDHIEQSIAAFRSELTEIRHAITEAMPRRAIESIENEIRSLSRRIDDTRQSGIDGQALAGIERALGEIREVLRSLTPAEQLAGYDEAIRNLGAKLDLILRSNDDPSTIHQLEGAIAALRAIVSNIASNDALARLSDDVHVLSSKVDQLARSDGHADAFATLEQRIAALTSSLENREQRPAASENAEHIEGAIRALSDRLDRMPVGNDNASAFAHLEQRVTYLLERVEASADSRGGNLGRVEEGLQDILRHLELQQTGIAAFANNRSEPGAADSGLADIVKRELSDIRFSQAETDRHTQDSLEAVHNALGHVVDRLAMIEGDLRSARVQPAAAAPPEPPPEASYPAPPEPAYNAPPEPTAPAYAAPFAEVAQWVAMAPQPKPELPNPAAMQEHFDAAPREFHAPRRSCRRPSRSQLLRPSAKFWNRTRPRRAPRSPRTYHPITHSNPEPGQRGERLRHRSVSPLPRAPSAEFQPGRKSPSAPRVSSPPPAARPRPPRPRRLPTRPAAR